MRAAYRTSVNDAALFAMHALQLRQDATERFLHLDIQDMIPIPHPPCPGIYVRGEEVPRRQRCWPPRPVFRIPTRSRRVTSRIQFPDAGRHSRVVPGSARTGAPFESRIRGSCPRMK